MARIIGIIDLYKKKEISEEERAALLDKLELQAKEMDRLIKAMNKKLENEE